MIFARHQLDNIIFNFFCLVKFTDYLKLIFTIASKKESSLTLRLPLQAVDTFVSFLIPYHQDMYLLLNYYLYKLL